jgi:hypothetical protein
MMLDIDNIDEDNLPDPVSLMGSFGSMSGGGSAATLV